MTHDPNVFNALYFSLDGRFFKLRVLTVVFFWHAIRSSSMRVLPARKLVGLVPFYLWSISHVGASSSRTCTVQYYDTLFVTDHHVS